MANVKAIHKGYRLWPTRIRGWRGSIFRVQVSVAFSTSTVYHFSDADDYSRSFVNRARRRGVSVRVWRWTWATYVDDNRELVSVTKPATEYALAVGSEIE